MSLTLDVEVAGRDAEETRLEAVVTMRAFQGMVGRRRWKASAAPSLVMTQSSLSHSMMVRSKSNTTTTSARAAAAAAAIGVWQWRTRRRLSRFSGGTR